MDVTLELSMYPLSEAYEEYLLAFIDDLKSDDRIEVRVNETSTHLFGPYDLVFDLLKNSIRKSYDRYGKNVFVIKMLGGNLKGSADHL